jgi:signal transduction histidine kinase
LRVRIVGFLIFVLFGKVAAQSPTADSLRQLLRTSQGTQRADVLNYYGYVILSYNYVDANNLIQEALDLSVKLKYQKGQAEAFLYKGTIEDRIGNDSTALDFFQRALVRSERIKDRQLMARILTAIGLAYQHKNNLDSAQNIYQQSYQLLKDSLNPLYLSFLYLRLAELNGLKNNQAKQLSFLMRSWEIRKKLTDKHPLVWAGMNLANYYIDQSDFDRAMWYVNYAQQELGHDTLNEEAAIIYRNKAVIVANQGDHMAALDLFAKAQRFYEQNPFRWNLVDLLIETGRTQTYVANYEISLKYLFQALELAQANQFKKQIAAVYFRIAWVYYSMGQNVLAKDFAEKCWTIAEGNRFDFEEASACNLMGLISLRMKEDEDALNQFNCALEIRDRNNFRTGYASTLLNIGELYEMRNEFKKAEEYDLKSLTIETEINHALGICNSCQNLGQLYTKMGEYEKATFYLSKGEGLSKKIRAKGTLLDIYKNKRDLFKARGEFRSAMNYSMLHESLRDSMINENLANRVVTLQHYFEMNQKDKEIKILNQQRELQDVEIKQQRVAIAVGILVTLAVSIAAYVVFGLYKRVKRLNAEISERNEEIVAQSEELREANDALGNLNTEISEQKKQIEEQAEELAVSNQTIARINEGLEEKIKDRTAELKEAYHELDTFFYRSSHDFRRPLTTFMGLAEVAKVMIKDKPALELFEKVNDTARNLDKMLFKLQSVSAAGTEDLANSEISFKNIFQTEIRSFDEEILKRKIHVNTEVDVKRPFYSFPTLLNFIVQNLLENSISFSRDDKTEICLSAKEVGNDVIMTIRDNGIGIDPVYLPRVFEMYFRANERSTGNGLGLYIVKKMVDKMNGRIEIKSELGKGTEVKMFIPFTLR